MSSYDNPQGYRAGKVNTIKLESVGGALLNPLDDAVQRISASREKRLEADKRRAFQQSEREASQDFQVNQSQQAHTWNQENAEQNNKWKKEDLDIDFNNRLKVTGQQHKNKLAEIKQDDWYKIKRDSTKHGYTMSEIGARGYQQRLTAETKNAIEKEAGVNLQNIGIDLSNVSVTKPTVNAQKMNKKFVDGRHKELKEVTGNLVKSEKAIGKFDKQISKFVGMQFGLKKDSEKYKKIQSHIDELNRGSANAQARGQEFSNRKAVIEDPIEYLNDYVKTNFGDDNVAFSQFRDGMAEVEVDHKATKANVTRAKQMLLNKSNALTSKQISLASSMLDEYDKISMKYLNDESERRSDVSAEAAKIAGLDKHDRKKSNNDLYREDVKAQMKELRDSDKYESMTPAQKAAARGNIIKNNKKLYKIK